MKAHLDENLPAPLARALHALSQPEGHAVQHASEIDERGATDLMLFQALMKDAFTIHVTQDHHHRKAIERHAISSQGKFEQIRI